ncbi:class I SAM-dependent methyltransferase [Candidatus Thioglobus sp.]|jgi:trans-aconitate methyltransferase|uniref:class I SAM-dependent methyltransferase n=1 Tax=Candidatus Thioglobus sp. TaxID=2026721 RepID=UPI001D69D410|nr:class I SAM-dependent methyltransferase [Candidatus Thioglobus sp.]MBT3277654.1 class I SAM-dependent methyltransferase [Candidatus Thioglobus sp.]MBT3447219.1 class I SAM-dependent methyltransferase [Candidatus Thioglobus sp.]MBT6278895.1 class I SAM-dependent methyltransferase [Candidatus Thioglobus sp.]MBT6360517.1 class I SAM-dependent methyltransferase [Candidatus Thioglobus sp.]MBT7840080.1 class I SAM-dependent methyltransferase [Candidatus Thioglobus sp.]
MSQDQIIKRHQHAFRQFGHHPNALLWSGIKIQYLRFEQLAKINIQTRDSLLDVGCGFADLNFYLTQQNIPTQYQGIDIVEDFIVKAKVLYPKAQLSVNDLFTLDPEPNSIDYLMLSGALNYVIDDADNKARQTIEKMFATCRKGIAFNLLDNDDQWSSSRNDLQTYNKQEVESWVKKLTSNYQIIDNYLDNDFTLLAWKE